ncbi:MAG: cupin domain-containing protein [Chitinophagaceae bacterium]|nr:MAG: cupin domain-containing protein [Chitinophagaceae bacterium]
MQLQPHPEGGYFKETYRSGEVIETGAGKSRNISTAILYLLEDEDFSAFHRIQSDELWFFHQGQALEVLTIQNGKLVTILLGNDAAKGEVPQAMVPANIWFGSRIKNRTGFALVSCTVAPGFDFADFELADREELISEFPDLKEAINTLAR